MKSPWVWLVGFVFLIYLFSDDKSEPSSYQPDALVTDVAPSQSYSSPRNFGGYPCIDDCSGHEAGYDWAEENGIDDPDDCDGNSDSFIEGCQSYADDQGDEVEYSDDYGYSDGYEFED